MKKRPHPAFCSALHCCRRSRSSPRPRSGMRRPTTAFDTIMGIVSPGAKLNFYATVHLVALILIPMLADHCE